MEDGERPVTEASQQTETPSEMPSSTAVLHGQPPGSQGGQINVEIGESPQNKLPSGVGFIPASVAATMAAANERWDETPEDDILEEPIEMKDVKNVVNKIEDNIDEALDTAAQSLWSFASSVTGVTDAATLGRLRQNVSSHLAPLGQNLSSKLEQLAPTDHVANLAGSVKNVAKTVQRNAQEMERAILAKANGEGDVGPQFVENEVILDDIAAGAGMGTRNVATSKMLPSGKDGTEHSNDGHASKDQQKAGALGVEEGIARVGEMVGASIEKTVGGFWSGLWGAEDDPKWEMVGREGHTGQPALRAPTTRFEKRIHDLQANPDTYCEPASDIDAFAEWGNAFSLDDHADECIEILSKHESIAELYERVVPNIVDEDTFWMRYYFAKHKLEQEEVRRQRLLQRAENGVSLDQEDDDGWGDDDWEDDSDVINNRNGDNEESNENESGGDAVKNEDSAIVETSAVSADVANADESRERGSDEGAVQCETTVVEIERGSQASPNEDKGEDEPDKDGTDAPSVQESTVSIGDAEAGKDKRKSGRDDASSNAASQLVANDLSEDGDWGDDWE